MKNIVLASLVSLLLHPIMAQVNPDRRTPRKEAKTTTPPGQVISEGEVIFYNNQQIVIYDQANFTGQSKSFGVGTYRFNTPADFNDLASSIKIPNGMIAVIYEHANETGGFGRYVDLLEDCTDLSTYDFSDKVSYLSVFSASRPGFVYARNRMSNNQFVAGHWERQRANGNLPDNSVPATVSRLVDRPNTTSPNDGPGFVPPKSTTGDNQTPRVFEEMPVYRIQLRLTTGTTQDAGTDNPVYAQMNVMDEKFYLVKGIDNFQEGKTVTYDMLSLTIKRVKDIEFIKFGIKGDDGVCIKKIELLLNGNSSPLYSRTFDGVKGVCIDNGSTALQPTLEIPGAMLRSGASWNDAGSRLSMWVAPIAINIAWLKSSIEGSIGNQLYQGGDLRWSSYATGPGSLYQDAVKIRRVDDHTLRFNIELERAVYGPNPLINMSFDLDFHCTDGAISCDIEKLGVETNWLGDVRDFIIEKGSFLAAAAITVYTGGLGFPSFFGAALLRLNNSFSTPNPGGGAVSAACTKAQVTANGDIMIK